MTQRSLMQWRTPAFCTALLLALAGCLPALADGPHIAFHGSQGAYTVTLFTAPDPLVSGPVEFTLLVQNASDGTVVSRPRATVDLTLKGQPTVHVALAAGGATNRLLPGAVATLIRPGAYELAIEVSSGGAPPVTFHGGLPVDSNNGRRNTLLISAGLTLLLIVLFLVNQYARQQRRPHGRPAVL